MPSSFYEKKTEAGNQNKGRTGNRSKKNSGQGRGFGPGGNCVCPGCGTTLPHSCGYPCSDKICPNCGTPMVRE